MFVFDPSTVARFQFPDAGFVEVASLPPSP
jgi:hypothetical protein